MSARVRWMSLMLVPMLFALLPAQEDLGRRYALLVGVQKYDSTGLGNLKFCENDVGELAKVFTAQDYKRVVLLTRTEANKLDRDDILPNAENIRNHLKGILKDRKETDTVVLAFAGHGVQLKTDGKMYFCPARCNLDKPETLLALDEVYEALKECKAATRVLLVDACRNDPLDGRASGDEHLQSLSRPQLPDPPGGAVVLFSCSKGQRAFESDKYKHGFLFQFVIEGLKGKAANKKTGQVAWLGLAKYVTEELPDAVKDEKGALAEQTPEVRGEARGQMVLARIEVGTRPPDETQEEKPKTLTLDLDGVKLDLVRIEPGAFQMGATAKDKDAQEDEKPRHEVEISQPFYLGKFHVTRGQFRAFVKATRHKTEAEMGEGASGWNPDTKKFEKNKDYNWENVGFDQTDDHPVVCVSWNDAVAFCRWLNDKKGGELGSKLGGKSRVKLPTEAQWEYACRAGSAKRFHFGDEDEDMADYGNVADVSARKTVKGITWGISKNDGYPFTSPVGKYQPNAWKLHDMHGNAWQWCEDFYDATIYSTRAKNAPVKDPVNLKIEIAHVLRGGSWFCDAGDCHAAYRYWIAPSSPGSCTGFRVAVRQE
jgi:formylglycine-generating enzyme required for sulfatase activity